MSWEMEIFLCYAVLDVSVVQQIVMFKQYYGMGSIKKGLHLTGCHSSPAHSIARKTSLLKGE